MNKQERKFQNCDILLSELENKMGSRTKIKKSSNELASWLGLSAWSQSLRSKFEKLAADGRIEFIKIGKKSGFEIRLLKPLTNKEKTNLKVVEKNEEEEKYKNLPTGNLSDEVLIPNTTEDIDIIFDDFTSLSRDIMCKYRELKEENQQLKYLLDNAKQREKKWMTLATEYKQKLILNK